MVVGAFLRVRFTSLVAGASWWFANLVGLRLFSVGYTATDTSIGTPIATR